MLIINNRFLSLYDYNFLLVIEKIRNSKIWKSHIIILLVSSLLNFLSFLLKILFSFTTAYGDLSFGILFIWKLHQIHFVFFFIVLGYQSLFYTSLNSSSLLLISIAGKDFTSHRIIFLSLSLLLLGLSLVFIFGSEIY